MLKSALRTTAKPNIANQLMESDEVIQLDGEFKEIQKDGDAGGNYEEEFEHKASNLEQRYSNANDDLCQNDGFDILQELEEEKRVNTAILKSEEERLKEAQSSIEDNILARKGEASEDFSQNDSFPCIITNK